MESSEKSPCISVLMPSLNVAQYIRECMESVVNQTLKNIEIICIDAGSTDGTLEILREYECADKRVRVVLSDKKSYGHQMNLGLSQARGEYIGIIETDDFADVCMYGELYKAACENQAQVVKANYYNFLNAPTRESIYFDNFQGLPYNTVLEEEDDRTSLLLRGPSIWSGIYQRKMLLDHGVGFLETPGASFQDTAFILKVWMVAERVVVLKDAYLHYRNDNLNSSVHSNAKVFYICDEMTAAHEFMNTRNEWRRMYGKTLWARRADAYLWNYERLHNESRLPFLERMSEEFNQAEEAGELEERAFSAGVWNSVMQIIRDPRSFYEANKASLGRESQPAAPSSSELQPLDAVRQWPVDVPTVSVVITTCNAASRIGGCLESVFSQTFDSYEVIIVDAGSTDGTTAVPRDSFAHEGRLWVVTTYSANAAAARSLGLRHARGSFCLFLDVDDRLSPTMLEKLVGKAQETEADLVCCASQSPAGGAVSACGLRSMSMPVDGRATCNRQDFSDDFFSTFGAWTSDKLFSRNFIESKALWSQSLKTPSTACLALCALALAEKIALVDEVLCERCPSDGAPGTSQQGLSYDAFKTCCAVAQKLAEEHVLLQVEESLARWGAAQAAEEKEPLAIEVERLNAQLNESQAELTRLREDFAAVTGSTSFKVGRKLTSLPRLLRDRLRGA